MMGWVPSEGVMRVPNCPALGMGKGPSCSWSTLASTSTISVMPDPLFPLLALWGRAGLHIWPRSSSKNQHSGTDTTQQCPAL